MFYKMVSVFMFGALCLYPDEVMMAMPLTTYVVMMMAFSALGLRYEINQNKERIDRIYKRIGIEDE